MVPEVLFGGVLKLIYVKADICIAGDTDDTAVCHLVSLKEGGRPVEEHLFHTEIAAIGIGQHEKSGQGGREGDKSQGKSIFFLP